MNTIQRLRKEACDKHAALLAYYDKMQELIAPLLEEFEKLNPTAMSVEDGYTSISLTGDKHVLNAAFGILRRHGFNTTSRPEAKQSTYSTFFSHAATESYSAVYFNFSSTQCRRIKTGSRERTVTEDVYELVCDEMELPERAEAEGEAA